MKHGKTMINGDHQEFSSRSDSSSSDSDSSSSSSSSSSDSEELENGDVEADYPVINDSIEQPTTAIVETVSC